LSADDFVLGELPSSPARVLEVGCGSGELARALAEAGYEVLAIDPDAPEGQLFRRTKIEDVDSTETFDAVVAQLSLHHVADLGTALDKVVDLLAPQGRLVIDDFGWERLDQRAADDVGIPFDEWREEHEHLHTAEAMLAEMDARFVRRTFSWEPFLFREGRRVMDEARERTLIGEGRLPALGFQYVGER
jgi:2-polyprenyl-3-methyl-5-hydroxy-6-metoxy-1,4-benzoquinol methylase